MRGPWSHENLHAYVDHFRIREAVAEIVSIIIVDAGGHPIGPFRISQPCLATRRRASRCHRRTWARGELKGHYLQSRTPMRCVRSCLLDDAIVRRAEAQASVDSARHSFPDPPRP
eukprot:6179950-Prymnesium_polylepis.1